MTSAVASHRRALGILFLAVLTNLIGFGIIIPLLPFYGQAMGASELQIGLLFASFSVAQLLSSPVWGTLSDRYGRKPFLLLGLLGAAAGFVIMALAPSLEWLFIARLVDGACGGMIATVRAYLSDVLEERERARGFGFIGAAFGIGFIAGPALGSLLVQWNLKAPAWAAAALSLLAAAVVLLWLPEPSQHRPLQRGILVRRFAELWGLPALRPLLLFDLLYWSCQAVYQTGFALFLYRRFGASEAQVGALLAVAGGIGVLTQLVLVGRVTRRWGETRTLVVGTLLAALGLGAAALVPTIPLFVLCLVPAAVGAGLASPALLSLLSRTTPQPLQGSLQGVTTSLESFARIVGPIWGNGLLQFGLSLPFLSAAAVLLGVSVAAGQYHERYALAPDATAQSPAERVG
jgi:DHA1 family tetracycline resistance protein-like MFS transporter